jgi:hypothetical protein
MPIVSWLSTTALSFVVSGNTGVSPFLSLFIVGLVERTNPTMLQMDGTIEWVLSSWISIVVLGLLTILELVGKCIPVIDEVIDSMMTFVVPIFSILGSLSTFGLFTMANNNTIDIDTTGDGHQGRRALSVASSGLFCIQFVVLAVGIILALCTHGIKMLIRLIG